MSDQEDHQDQPSTPQDASTDDEMLAKSNGVDRYDTSNPLIQLMVEAVTNKIKLQIDPLLIELTKLARENSPQISNQANEHAKPPTQLAEHTIGLSPSSNPKQADNRQEIQHLDESHVDKIAEIVLSRIMAEVSPILLELAKIKQEKQTGLGGMTNQLGKNNAASPQMMQEQMTSRVMELENLIKEKISARELRFQAMMRKPNSR
ncbi:hypothetical protein [Agrobacterium vitis]|uniref:hypothetical protein n=1 Tax=Agrobacterium vitis TaxID=373 RepID=UPI0008727B88|nr:hypothetical protein [Agrobacterium vitis]MCE6076504.1 hypothetical protein [Agrobacterium vitis]MCM2451656.1 hypothetical protein [Agrobacterium vitis]MCM2471202.1 hypothetical protein [Agrobacterium vitis]MUO70194.1 hypothetical protein [Agrobacterium vitis]MUO85483.1 hypothetical protein [Agrobacterium vitis]